MVGAGRAQADLGVWAAACSPPGTFRFVDIHSTWALPESYWLGSGTGVKILNLFYFSITEWGGAGNTTNNPKPNNH